MAEHADVGAAVLAETAKLHAGDPENLRLWREFLPVCLEDIQRIYRRLHVRFDHTLGESFYNDQLAADRAGTARPRPGPHQRRRRLRVSRRARNAR